MDNFIASLLVIFSVLLQIDASKWRYDGDLGPRYWKHLFPDGCSGKQQSPIDIETSTTQYDPNLNDFAIWYDPPKPNSLFHVVNNGHAIQVNVFGPFHIANGGLPSLYSTAQFHFHWGHANHQGSEHLIDSRASPLELHVVNFDSINYKGIGEAMIKPMGLAVLGVMYEVGEEDNAALEPIIQAMEHVKDPEDDNTKELPAQPIRNFLPQDTTRYFRYNGSLTTPGCFESVLWTVFHEPQYISHRQLLAFRRVLQNKRHKKKHRRHIRSSSKDEKMVEEVLTEAGIKNDPLEKLELQVGLEKQQGSETVPSEAPKLGEPPNKFYLHHEKNPNMDKLMTDVNQSSHQKNEQTYHHVESENEKRLEKEIIKLEHEIERLVLVNNFRPVQELNGRTVYRSFSSFTRPVNPASQERNKDNDDPNNYSTRNISSSTVIFITLLLTFFR